MPLLVVQGSADPINPPGCSALIYDHAPPPKDYLDLLGASHFPPYLDPGAARDDVAVTVIDFLDAYLRHQPSRLDRLLSVGTAGPGSQLSHAAVAPASASACPGAP